MVFSGKELIQGEPDASSVSHQVVCVLHLKHVVIQPGIATSPVFVKKDGENTTLYIPSAFCSYTGESIG